MKVFLIILTFCLFIKVNAQTNPEHAPPANNVLLASADKSEAIAAEAVNKTVVAPEPKALKDSSTSDKSDKKEALLGIASMYSTKFEGAETSTGETFSQKLFTAASNFFKLNTVVKVTNLRTGKSVIVRINDRMHPAMAAKGRVVDLSMAAAHKIGLTLGIGLTKVKVEVVKAATKAVH